MPTSYDQQYVRLLNHVIMLAGRTAFSQNSDSASTANCVNGSSTQGLASKTNICSESQLAHDIKIEPAGELYICPPSPFFFSHFFLFFSFHFFVFNSSNYTDRFYVISAKADAGDDRHSNSFDSMAYQALPGKIGKCA